MLILSFKDRSVIFTFTIPASCIIHKGIYADKINRIIYLKIKHNGFRTQCKSKIKIIQSFLMLHHF